MSGSLSASQDRRRAGSKSFGVLDYCLAWCLFLRYWGRFPWWGVFGPLGTTVPRASPQESRAAHGPRHPAVSLSGLCLLFCSVFWAGCWVFCVFFFFSVSGVGIILLELVPFRTRPLSAEMFVVLSFSLVVWLVSTTPFSLFLSLSGAGEAQAPFRGFGIPLVSLQRRCALRPRPVHLHLLLHPGFRPALFFCSFLRRSRGCFLVWFSLSCLSVGLSGLVVSGCVACKKILRQHRPGRGDRYPVQPFRAWCTEPVSPPTPFLPNTVKDSPGRRWGT